MEVEFFVAKLHEKILMKMARYSDSQILAILRPAKGGVPVSGRCPGQQDARRQFLQVAVEVWQNVSIDDWQDEGA